MKTKNLKIHPISKASYCKQFCTNCGNIRKHLVVRNPTGLDAWRCTSCGAVRHG